MLLALWSRVLSDVKDSVFAANKTTAERIQSYKLLKQVVLRVTAGF
jgi:hypothetical protein